MSAKPPLDYVVGPNDTLEIYIPDLALQQTTVPPIFARVMADGTIRLPLVEPIRVGGLNLAQVQEAIHAAYSPEIIVAPRVSVTLARAATYDVSVLGEVTQPGVYTMARYQNDIAHALALAGGMTQFAGPLVEVHRKMTEGELLKRLPAIPVGEGAPEDFVLPEAIPFQSVTGPDQYINVILRIPLRGGQPAIVVEDQLIPQQQLTMDDVKIKPGDVIVVPRQPDPVFFVVGPLSESNVVNFRVSELDRRLGNAFLLPNDRDVDVVTAVAMAGYIDPIDSPSTVTVQRAVPGASPLLIRVDLIAARYDWSENVYVQPGDIIYLNPDAAWWWRRTFDRIVPDLITIPYAEAMARWINPRGRNN